MDEITNGAEPGLSVQRPTMDEPPPPLHVLLEFARLVALRSAIAFEEEGSPQLDAIAAAAAACMGRTMGAVCFVDEDRLWFAGVHGVDWRESPRHGSLCDQTIAQSGMLVVRDAAADPRFCEHPDVQEPRGVRFYAGCSIEDEGGYRLGAVCVFDREPGAADPAGLAELGRLAGAVSAELAAGRLAREAGPQRVQGWLGVRARGSSRFLASKPGLIVLSIAAGSPAEEAGLRPTDVILAIDGRELWHAADLEQALANRVLGGIARLLVLRAGRRLERDLAIAERPARPVVEAGPPG